MAYWFDNPGTTKPRKARVHRKRRRTVRRNNSPAGGVLLMANKRRKRRTKRAMPAGLKRYHAARRRRRTVSVVRANPKHRARVHTKKHRARSRSKGVGGVPATVGGFVSVKFLTMAGYAALGAVAPSFVTDKLLPMVGLTLTGYTRRIAQFAVPAAVVMLGGKKLLGSNALPFVVTAAGVTLLGLVNDVTGGVAVVGRYALPAPQMGRYSATSPVLAR